MSFELQDYMETRKVLIQEALLHSLPHQDTDPKNLFAAMHYSLMAPGKRVRPILTLATATCLGMPVADVMPIGVAIEMIHVFSLIHDDLPCMDDDDLRRGQPTNHKVYGEAHAVLAGDALLAQAFVPLTELDATRYSATAILKVIRFMALATGTEGMIVGQAIDIESEGQEIGLERLQKLHRYKTGALIRASILAPAMLAEIDEHAFAALDTYANAIGLAFQIADDILDIEGVDIGKDVGSDVAKDKSTYPKFLGLQASKEALQHELQRAVEALTVFGASADPLRALARYIVERKK